MGQLQLRLTHPRLYLCQSFCMISRHFENLKYQSFEILPSYLKLTKNEASQGFLRALSILQRTPMDITLPTFLGFWFLFLTIFKSTLHKFEWSNEIQDHILMPLDMSHLIASDIQHDTHKRNKDEQSWLLSSF